jgi:hypothetical protein
MSARPSIEEQIARVRAVAPYMTLTGSCDWFAFWAGPLRPLQRTYSVTVGYLRRRWLGDMELENAYEALVRLGAPELVATHPRTGEDVPHVYWDGRAPERSALCLYDPAADEWSSADFIADTILPWACDWLVCYEGWLATGVWSGGGRHPRRRGRRGCPLSAMGDGQRPDQRERALRAGFARLGHRTGTFASLPLMVAASAGFTRPLSWRDWRGASSAAPRWETIST